jgi:hypothetical protein
MDKNKIICMLVAILVSSCATVDRNTKMSFSAPKVLEPPTTATIFASKLSIWHTLAEVYPKYGYRMVSGEDYTGNISFGFRANPEDYIDCGKITIYRSDGDKSYPGSKASITYKAPSMDSNKEIVIEQTMTLNGRMNFFIHEVAEKKCVVIATGDYNLKQRHVGRDEAGNLILDRTETISFSTGESAKFQKLLPLECRPKHNLEKDMLDAAEGINQNRTK